MFRWFSLTDDEQHRTVEDAMKELSPLECIGKCGKVLSANVNEAVNHLNQCLLSKYYTYMDKAEEFRQLSKDDQKQLTRDATYGSRNAPCLNYRLLDCQMKYNHYNALTYHVNRCGLDPEVIIF